LLKEGGMRMKGTCGQELIVFAGLEPAYLPFFRRSSDECLQMPGLLFREKGLRLDEIDGVELDRTGEDDFGDEVCRKAWRKESERQAD
jgi:hypothetical protein